MSAFIVKPEHIGQLVLWFLQNKDPGWHSINLKNGRTILLDPKDLVLELAHANCESVAYRYKQARQLGLCGEVWEYMKKVRHAVKISAADAWQMASCLGYQSCEHPGYEGSSSEKVLDMIKDLAGEKLAKGFQAARGKDNVWEYTDDNSEPGQIDIFNLKGVS